MTAVSGNSENINKTYNAVNNSLFKIETALGIHHAVSLKKNLVLMTGSFALSIILFLIFSVFIDFIGYLMPQSSSTPDISISSNNNTNLVDKTLLAALREMDGVKRVFGHRSSFNIPAEINGNTSLTDKVDMISYDDFDLNC